MASLLMIYCILLTSILFFLLSPPTRPPRVALALSLFSPLINDSFLKPFLSMRPTSSLTFSLIILLFVFLFFLSFFPPRPPFPPLPPFPSFLLALPFLLSSSPFLSFFPPRPPFPSFLLALPFFPSLFPFSLPSLATYLLPPDYFVVCLFSFPSFLLFPLSLFSFPLLVFLRVFQSGSPIVYLYHSAVLPRGVPPLLPFLFLPSSFFPFLFKFPTHLSSSLSCSIHPICFPSVSFLIAKGRRD